jgi:WD40 repeat protein
MNGDVQLLDLVNMKPDRALKGRANKWGLALAWSPDGLRLAAARSTVTLFDIKTGVETLTLDGHADFIRSAAFSPDGLRLSTASMDKSIKVWELESGKTLFTLEPSGLAVFTESGPQIAPVRLPMTAAAFSPDGSRLATAGADRVIRLWNVSDGKAIKEFIGHRMTVTAVEFSPDGRRLVSASLDHTLRLWELD